MTQQRIVNGRIVLLLVLSIFGFACVSGEDRNFGLVEMFHGKPKPVRVLPRSIYGGLPTGASFTKHTIEGILVMDSGIDYDVETALTYLTYLKKRYTLKNGQGDVPFHYFIDSEGITYGGRDSIMLAQLHQGDPFTLRAEGLEPQDRLVARMAHKTRKQLPLNGYITVVILGDYDRQLVSDKQEKALFQLLAMLTHKHTLPLDGIKGLKSLHPETGNPGFYLNNYLNPTTLEKNIPPPPGIHRFLVPPKD